MKDLRFSIRFFSPFLSATGHADGGYDATVDPTRPLSESTLKGAMAHAAEHVLRASAEARARVFGRDGRDGEGGWTWILGEHEYADQSTATRHRVSIDSDTHTAEQDQLLKARVALLKRAEFEIIAKPTRRSQPEPWEAVLLTAAARSVHRLGAQGARGLGWVGISGGIGELHREHLRDLRQVKAPTGESR